MPVEVVETYRSRVVTVAADGTSSAELAYTVGRSEIDTEIIAAVDATAPSSYLGLPLDRYRLEHVGAGIWNVSASYKAMTAKTPEAGAIFSFDTTNGTARITHSRETVYTGAPIGKDAPDFHGAIGVNGDKIEGTDVTVPVFSFSYLLYVPIADVDTAYILNLYALTGKVNNATWKGFPKGEALFLGAQGGQRGVENYEITMRFAAKPNIGDLTIDSILAADVEGWHHVWVFYEDTTDTNTLVKKARAVYVERVYDYADFSLLGL